MSFCYAWALMYGVAIPKKMVGDDAEFLLLDFNAAHADAIQPLRVDRTDRIIGFLLAANDDAVDGLPPLNGPIDLYFRRPIVTGEIRRTAARARKRWERLVAFRKERGGLRLPKPQLWLVEIAVDDALESQS